jgi:glycosyltransferase involved in cell wall biosynthesis
MNILQVSTADIGGGAEKVAWNLFRAYQKRGHPSWLAVGFQRSNDPGVLHIPGLPPSSSPWARLPWGLYQRFDPFQKESRGRHFLRAGLLALSGVRAEIERRQGREDFNFRGSWKLLKLPPQPPDIIHAHNLHGGYFDLRYFTDLSRRVPVVWTLHDEWALTGHCAYSIGCQRWRTGCGHCPDLNIYPSLLRDATDWNWQRKRGFYQKSCLHVATPSHWLMDEVQLSMIEPVESRVIPYGVDLATFHPVDPNQARTELGLPIEPKILLFTASKTRHNMFKDYTTIEQALHRLGSEKDFPLMFLSLGGSGGGEEQIGNLTVRHISFIRDADQVARYYQSADIFLHAARTDNFPNTVLEALACGTPVIATDVGGIPEQVYDGETGFLTPPSDPAAMADRIKLLLNDSTLRQAMALRAAEDARKRFDLDRQVSDYLEWYLEILDNPKTTG